MKLICRNIDCTCTCRGCREMQYLKTLIERPWMKDDHMCRGICTGDQPKLNLEQQGDSK